MTTGVRIRAIRAAELGPFRDGVALEGLSGGLDVLTGPNEAGKSTLFSALAALVGSEHTSTAKAVQALRSDAGGAPLIEADFDIDGRSWRIRKRFLAQRMAEVCDLVSGELWRGADAEVMLRKLLAADGRDALRPLLWVEQTAGLTPPEAKADLAAALSMLIEREAADAAGIGQARLVRDGIRARLDKLVTDKKGKPKKGGPLEVAQTRAVEIAVRLEAARDKAGRTAGRAGRLEVLASQSAGDLAPAALATADQRRAVTQAAVAAAERARERLKAADERLTSCRLQHDHSLRELERYETQVADVARLSNEAGALHAEHLEASAALTDAERGHGEALVQRNQTADALAATRQRLSALIKAVARTVDLERARRAGQRLTRAMAAAERLRHVRERLALATVDETAVTEARRLHGSLAALDSRLEAAGTRITMAYAPGVTTRLVVADRTLDDGCAVLLGEVTRVTIEGVGTLTIEPAATGAAVVAQRERQRRELADLLHGLGVPDMASAEAALAAFETARREEVEANALLAAEAPEGCAVLELEYATAEALTHNDGDDLPEGTATHKAPGDTPDPPGDAAGERRRLEQCEADLGLRLVELDRLLVSAENALRQAAARAAELQARAAAVAGQLEALVARVAATGERDIRRSELTAAVEQASHACETAARDRQGWAIAAPDTAGYEALVRAAEAAGLEARRLQTRRQQLLLEMAELEGALRQDDAEGAGAEVVRLEEALAAAQRRVDDLELEVAALMLIGDRLDSDGGINRTRIIRPLAQRLEALLGTIFPEARIALDGPVLVTHLERAGTAEVISRLSGGTREQIAVLVRLAYARLMADRGIALPLVLDDALVYADDARLEHMFGLLASASLRHQVLVLSCRTRTFDRLAGLAGACRLKLERWDPREASRLAPATRAGDEAGSGRIGDRR